jgi:hypothetical protein
MQVQFIDHILGQEDNVFIFLHPQSLGSYNMVAFLISNSQLIGKSVLIITNNKDNINSCLPGALQDEAYMKYADFSSDNINSEIIILDDYSSSTSILDQLKLENNSNTKFIIFTRGNIKVEEDYPIFYLNLCEEGPILKHSMVLINSEAESYKDIIRKILLNVESRHLITAPKKEFEILHKYSGVIYSGEALTMDDTYNLDYIHLLKVELEYYQKLISIFYKRKLLDDHIDTFNIIIYVDRNNKSQVENYEKIIDYLESYRTNYAELLNRSIRVKYNDKIGLFIDKTKSD